jgi:hypothetical protein
MADIAFQGKSMSIRDQREKAFVKKYRAQLSKTCPYCGLGFETHEKRCTSAILDRGEIRRCLYMGTEAHEHVYRPTRAVHLTTGERERMH